MQNSLSKFIRKNIISFVGRLTTFQLVFIGIVLVNIICVFCSMFFHGRITYDYIITGSIASFTVGYLILKILSIYQEELKIEIAGRKKANQEKDQLVTELQTALATVKQLSGFFPICASCKNIRDDSGYWNQIEEYIQEHSDARFSHGICPDCAEKLYGDQDWYKDGADKSIR